MSNKPYLITIFNLNFRKIFFKRKEISLRHCLLKHACWSLHFRRFVFQMGRDMSSYRSIYLGFGAQIGNLNLITTFIRFLCLLNLSTIILGNNLFIYIKILNKNIRMYNLFIVYIFKIKIKHFYICWDWCYKKLRFILVNLLNKMWHLLGSAEQTPHFCSALHLFYLEK